MTRVLSIYYDPWHWWQSSEDYIQALQPPWIRIHQPSARAIHVAQSKAPNARIMLRSWDIDDHNGDRKREMYRDPIGAARQHIGMWDALRKQLQAELDANGYTYNTSQWYMGMINEPDPAYIPQLRDYSLEAMRLAVVRNWHLGVVFSSVGNFAKPSESSDGWEALKPLEQPILDGGHILGVHEYWQPEGPSCVWIDAEGKERHDAGNLAWRHHSIPLDVPILIGESGANGYIYNRHSDSDDAGWGRFMEPEQYAAQVREYIQGCDSRVQGVCLYMTDYHSDQWKSFDTTPAHAALLAIADTEPDESPGVNVYVPVISTPPANEPVQPQPDGDWERVRAFRIRWEGGFQNYSWDIGNWTGGKVGVGELKGTKYGISAASYPDLDIENLTLAEADAIYFRDYWQASGASELPWPGNLIVFDTAVLHGTGTAEAWLAEVGPDPLAFAAKRLRTYPNLGAWEQAGRGWVNRVADLLLEASRA